MHTTSYQFIVLNDTEPTNFVN